MLGRPGIVIEPRQLLDNAGAPGGDQKTTYTYVGLRTDIKVQDTTEQATALTMSRQVDALGRPVLTTDAAQGKNRYFYDAYGQTVALVDARGVATRAEYDPLGRRWVSYDPNLGTTQFTYNGLGELQTQTDARTRKLTFEYDALGRTTRRYTNGGHEFGSGSNNSVDDVFDYDPPNATGQLEFHQRNMTGTWGSSGTPRNFTERKQSFVYDPQGHLTARNTEQAVNVGSQTGTRRYSHRYVWDSRWGRLLGEAWPNGVGRGYVYDGVGRVVQENGLGTDMPAVLREVQEIDVRGQTIKAGLGDCVLGPCITQERSYAPSTGQMLTQSYSIEYDDHSEELHSERYRHDYLANLTQRERLSGNSLVRYERYTYDALQRLTWSGVYGGSLASSVNLTYDAVGNLTQKSDYAGVYSYPGGAVRPNAPTSTYTDTSSGPTNQTYYEYDASGNLIARSPNDSAPIATNNKTFQALYNHNHQVIFSATRPAAGNTAWEASSQYFYDAQNRLSRQIEGASGSTPEHLIYLEGYEDRVGGYRTRSYVDDYAHITRYRYGQLELRFVLTDRLGSVVGVVRADRDSGGSVRALEPEVGLAYDVFGAPRHASDWSPLVGAESWPQARNPWDVTPTTRHGFTGHEMLSKQRLIHMRGRLFDPRMGRFTGVDPVIQFPLNTQGLNPYSYLLNNPLAGTDPTGYAPDWESVQERMWAMAGGYGANGSSTTAVLNGLRSAAAAVGMSGAAGDAKAVASNGATTGQSAKQPRAASDPSQIQSVDSRPATEGTNGGTTANAAPPGPAPRTTKGSNSVGEIIDAWADGCGVAKCALAATTYAFWNFFGAEGVSQWYTKGWSGTSGGDLFGAGLEVAAALPPVRIVRGIGLADDVLRGGAAWRIGSTGAIGENALRALGGESQVFFRTSSGARYIDQLVNGIAHESKVGYQTLTRAARRQIAKDVELMQTRQIQGSTWHFFPSPVTGFGGASGPLMNALDQAGINVVVHGG